ncbi:glutamate receptor ionotropic, kainate 2-like [Euwallacea similis]|uniref:glutamate receptor ionotropic, kainate 2-like n=1 Tax=Euwallacea similis TaxID=1736056 RepID=UPI0034509808
MPIAQKFVYLILLICGCKAEIKTVYRVGGVFSYPVHYAAFEIATSRLNRENSEGQLELLSEKFNVSYYNTLEARRAVCSLLEREVVGIIGPSSIYSSNYIQAICDNKEIPQIEIHYDPKIARNRCAINLHPHPSELARFFVHLIRIYNWSRLIILFEDNESLVRIAPLFELNMSYGVHFIFRQLDKVSNGSYREVLSNIKKMPDTNILLDCSIDVLEEVLKQAQQVGIINDHYHYIITNLDLGTIDLEPFQYGGANITGIRLFDPTESKAVSFQSEIVKTLNLPEEEKYRMRLSTALLIDGLSMFYTVLQDLLQSHDGIEAQRLSCRDSDSWKYGYTIANQLKGMNFGGLTRNIRFDIEGFRSDFKLDLLELTTEGLRNVGQWNTATTVLTTSRRDIKPLEDIEEETNIFNTTFKVIIVLTSPYAMLKETTDQLVGNDRFEGFCIDVIQELSIHLGFNYTFVVQEDGKNGNLNRSSMQWDGVIRQIIDGKAELAITDLTITSEREGAVDFTMPFMNLGISILYRKPEPVPPSLFMFTSPFSTSVWLMLGVAYILVSIAIFIMGRLSPTEWNNPYPCIEEPEYFVNQFSIRNSLWFTIGGLLQQGSELAPISIATRTASGFWWFFVLIMVSSYTANLAAFLTVTTLVTPFKNIDELARQSEIKYGAKKQGATENFFRDSNVSVYQKVSSHLKLHPEEMTTENDEGVRRVETENYAYLMESTTIEYMIQRHCSLAQVGGLLDDKGYGIAMKKESPYRKDLSTEVIKLQETGVLTRLKIKWWKEKRGGSTCSSAKKDESESKALDLQNVGGVFLVLFVGAILAFFGSFLELMARIYKKCQIRKESFVHELKKEMGFFVQFKKNVKEVTPFEEKDGIQ